MNIITREIIGKTIVYIDQGQEYRYDDIVTLINKWHAVFNQSGLHKGDRIAVFDTQSIEHISLIIAASECGLQYYAIPKDAFVSAEEKFDYIGLGIKIVFVRPFETRIRLSDDLAGVGAEERCYWNIHQFDMSKIHAYFSMPNVSYNAVPNDIVILSQTSGTTGKPKEFAHTHLSLLTATCAAEKMFYKSTDKVLLYTTFNHVGVISTQLMPAIIAGTTIIGHYSFGGDSVLEKIIKYRPNKTIIFPSNLAQMMRLPEWENLKLDFLEEVICGGQLINKEFVNELLGKGVSMVHNIYGSSEALPPVLVSTVTTSRVESCYNSADYSVALGNPAGDWKVKIHDGILCVQGKALALADWITERVHNGFYTTGDRATFENNKYWTTGRADKMVRHRDVLINASAMERDLEEMRGIREAMYYVTDDDELIIGLKFGLQLSTDEQRDLIAHVRNTFHPSRIHQLKIKNSFDAIKGVTAFGDEL